MNVVTLVKMIMEVQKEGVIFWVLLIALKCYQVVAVVVVYGLNQGLGGALARVGTEYYMKDVQKVQPSEAQAYSGITNIPWIIKPIWGLLTDVVPILGYRRRPYFILAARMHNRGVPWNLLSGVIQDRVLSELPKIRYTECFGGVEVAFPVAVWGVVRLCETFSCESAQNLKFLRLSLQVRGLCWSYYHLLVAEIRICVIGILSMFFLSFHDKLHIVLALVSLTIGSAGVAIADTVDACVAQHSGIHPTLAPDMQSLCALSSSIGSLIGFSLSGVFVHLIGPRGVYRLLSIPHALVLLVGSVLKEPHSPSVAYNQIYYFEYQVTERFVDAATAMWTTLKSEDIWRPSLYMYLSFALSLNINEGLFYWETDSKAGPSFSQ
ncbi:probable folate-biopterin transporter 2, partial [Tanacetum coccineum]